jgi:putative DNA primase/helicase
VVNREADNSTGDISSASDVADPGGLSILRSKTGHYATKQYSLGRNGKLRKSSYGNATWFSVTTVVADSIYELAAMLDRVQHDPHAFVLRGALLPEANPQLTRRLLHPDPKNGYPASFRSAARQWVPIDFDGIPAPITIDPVEDPEGAIEYLIGLLPPEFQDATCWWQFTSSQGFKPDTLNARLWFWLDRPVPDEDLTRWAKAINKAAGRTLIDPAMFRAVQPH